MNRKQYAMERVFLSQSEKRNDSWMVIEEHKKLIEESRDFTLADVISFCEYVKENNGTCPYSTYNGNKWQKECSVFVRQVFYKTQNGTSDWDKLLTDCVAEYRYRNSKLVKALK